MLLTAKNSQAIPPVAPIAPIDPIAPIAPITPSTDGSHDESRLLRRRVQELQHQLLSQSLHVPIDPSPPPSEEMGLSTAAVALVKMQTLLVLKQRNILFLIPAWHPLLPRHLLYHLRLQQAPLVPMLELSLTTQITHHSTAVSIHLLRWGVVLASRDIAVLIRNEATCGVECMARLVRTTFLGVCQLGNVVEFTLDGDFRDSQVLIGYLAEYSEWSCELRC